MAFIGFLKQSTATTLRVGPFLDETDGKTAETALTLSQSDFILWKEGGTTGAQKNETTSGTHRENGFYTCPINATDTGTLGALCVNVHESGALPVRQDYIVVTANTYAAMVDGTDLWPVDVQQVNNSATAADLSALLLDSALQGTSDNTGLTATTTTMDASDVTEATTDHYKGRIIMFTSGALIRQATVITGYSLVGGRGRFVFNALTEIVPNGSTFLVI